ncbi:MAG: hypothetical protein AAFR61_00620 [Bacteroidota bacterium]
MDKSRVRHLQPEMRQEVILTLIYKGKVPAIKLYMKHTGCRLTEAKGAVERLGFEIEPGQAS